MNLTNQEIKNLELLDEYENIKFFNGVALLKSGDSFGELAIINNEPRKATIKCMSDCKFAYLEKQEYDKALRKIHVRNFNKKIDFMSSIPFFKNQTLSQLKKLILQFNQEKSFNINQYVFRQGMMPTHVYIIKEGDF